MADEKGEWVKALEIGGGTTPTQRRRNFDLYMRLKDGVPGDYQQAGLAAFVFEIPVDSVRTRPDGTLTFRLDPDDQCYHRLLNVICGHFDTKCDADEKLVVAEARGDALNAASARLSADLAKLEERVQGMTTNPDLMKRAVERIAVLEEIAKLVRETRCCEGDDARRTPESKTLLDALDATEKP